jgi:D-alanyl-D-alanine carboxypeptidase
MDIHNLSRRKMIASGTGLIVAPFVAPSITVAQALSPGSSPQATPSYASLDDLLASGVDKGVPGIALAVDRGGESLFSGAAGVSNMEEQTPLQPTDRFRIYSITKTFTATVILQLTDEGLLTLDDTVTQWLDDPAVAAIPNADTVTVRQLLNHTSGIYDYADEEDSPFYVDAFFSPDADWAKVWTMDELLAYAAGDAHEPYFAPGEGAHYSNTGYLLLGMIIEQATGNPFGEELNTHILTPLGLTGTSLEEGATVAEDVVDAYHLIEGELVNVTAVNLTWSWAAGGMTSTTADLQRFAKAVFSGELLSPESFEEMFTYVPGPEESGVEGAMGLYRVQTPLGEMAGMDGGGAGGTSYMMRLADEDVTVVVLANMAPDDGTVNGLLLEAFAWTVARS